MTAWKKFLIATLAALTLAFGFWAGHDFAGYQQEFNACIARGGDGLTRVQKKCFRREFIEVPAQP